MKLLKAVVVPPLLFLILPFVSAQSRGHDAEERREREQERRETPQRVEKPQAEQARAEKPDAQRVQVEKDKANAERSARDAELDRISRELQGLRDQGPQYKDPGHGFHNEAIDARVGGDNDRPSLKPDGGWERHDRPDRDAPPGVSRQSTSTSVPSLAMPSILPSAEQLEQWRLESTGRTFRPVPPGTTFETWRVTWRGQADTAIEAIRNAEEEVAVATGFRPRSSRVMSAYAIAGPTAAGPDAVAEYVVEVTMKELKMVTPAERAVRQPFDEERQCTPIPNDARMRAAREEMERLEMNRRAIDSASAAIANHPRSSTLLSGNPSNCKLGPVEGKYTGKADLDWND